MKKLTISIFSESRAGILHKVSTAFSRRKINILSLTVSESEVDGIFRYTLLVEDYEDKIQKMVLQLDKQVEVVKAFYHFEEEIVSQELALFKIPTSAMTNGNAEKIVREHNARFIRIEQDYAVVEKTGYREEIKALFNELSPLPILEYASSGRFSISKPQTDIKSFFNKEVPEELISYRVGL
jgi:acetolactate synthase-1/3 small subunit